MRALGKRILQSLLSGDVVRALRGGEDVYFFMAGLRYLRALEKFIFGDTNFGYLTLLLMFTLVVFQIFQRFVGTSWALFVAALFVTPLGAPFALGLPAYGTVASMGFPDPIGVLVFLVGLLLIIGRSPTPASLPSVSRGFSGGLLLAFAVILRPNLLPMATIVIAAAAAGVAWQRRGWQAAILLASFAPVGLLALHNWVFAGVFVPFTSSPYIGQLYKTPPATYLHALWDILRLDFTDGHLQQIDAQLKDWIKGPAQKKVFGFLHAFQILILLYVVLLGKRYDAWLRQLGLAAMAGHAVALTYVNTPRYHWLTWLLTSLVGLAWLREDGAAAFGRMFPALSERWRANARGRLMS